MDTVLVEAIKLGWMWMWIWIWIDGDVDRNVGTVMDRVRDTECI